MQLSVPALGIIRTALVVTMVEGWLTAVMTQADPRAGAATSAPHTLLHWRMLAGPAFFEFGRWITQHQLRWLLACGAFVTFLAVRTVVRGAYQSTVRRPQQRATTDPRGWSRYLMAALVGVSAATHTVFWGGFAVAALHRMAFLALVRLTAEHVRVQDERVTMLCQKLRLGARDKSCVSTSLCELPRAVTCDTHVHCRYTPNHRVRDYMTQLGESEASLVADVSQVHRLPVVLPCVDP